ncbi:MAG TPA: hypothetical protein PKJ08_13635 [Candidatus Cloacimonadota bacterium]|nr:hypothetical protein [Candidatus Cloacimonadota bacterium]HPM03825.1 hypothetical protein [Candidatus Cloacimonadota bacterium]
MEKVSTKSMEIANAIKENLLKPMYNGLKQDNQQVKDALLSELNKMNVKIEKIQKEQQEFIEALLNIKWDE